MIISVTSLSLSLSSLSLLSLPPLPQADYGKAVEYFQRCYELCQQLGDKEALEGARVQCGIAQAHHNMMVFSGVIGNQSDSNLCQLVAWKAGRMVPTGEEEEEEEEEKEEKDEKEEKEEEEKGECEEDLLNKDAGSESEELEQR